MRRYIILFLIISVLSVCFVFLVFLVCILVLVTRYENSGQSEDVQTHEYKYMEFSPSTNSSNVGIVSIYSELGNNDFLFYEKNDGNQILISNFGTEEYKCFGSCLCQPDERRATAIVTRGIVYLVAAVSSLIALEKAKEYFRSECVENLSGCSPSFVRSKIDSCEKIGAGAYSTDAKHEYVGYQGDRGYGKFSCHGNCLPRRFSKVETRERAEKFGCEQLYIEADVYLPLEDLVTSMEHSYAKARFTKEFLTPYCKKNSKEKFFYTWGKDKEFGQWKKIVLCTPGYHSKGNKSIKCSKIYPRRYSVDELLERIKEEERAKRERYRW